MGESADTLGDKFRDRMGGVVHGWESSLAIRAANASLFDCSFL